MKKRVTGRDLIHNPVLKAEALKPDTIAMIWLYPGTTEHQMREMIVGALPVADTHEGLYVSIGGHDDDPRELWEIPAAIDLAQKWIATGGLDVMRLDPLDYNKPQPGLDAFRMWLLAQRKMTHHMTITPAEVQAFRRDYEESCARGDVIEAQFKASQARHREN
jgi:hypothetical protein